MVTDVSQRTAGYSEPGDSGLARVSSVVYWLLVVMLLTALAIAPGYLPFMLLDQDLSNVPLAAACLVPVGPAYCAAVFALNRRATDDDLHPARAFLRGYRLNVLDALRVWVPVLLVLVVLAVNALYVDLAAVPAGFELVMLVLGAIVLAWTVHALTIVALFSFRARDVARLAAYYLVAKPLATLGTLSYLVLAAGVVYLASDWVLILLSSIFTGALLHNERPVLRDLADRFVAD